MAAQNRFAVVPAAVGVVPPTAEEFRLDSSSEDGDLRPIADRSRSRHGAPEAASQPGVGDRAAAASFNLSQALSAIIDDAEKDEQIHMLEAEVNTMRCERGVHAREYEMADARLNAFYSTRLAEFETAKQAQLQVVMDECEGSYHGT